MIRILYFPSDTKNGVWYYRAKTPMLELCRAYSEFSVEISNKIDFGDAATLNQLPEKYDILIVHNGIFNAEAQDKFWKALIWLHSQGVKLVLDIDDYWDYGAEHPLYSSCISTGTPQKMAMNFNFFDLITTTTYYFAEKIHRVSGKPVCVLPNGISMSDKQFSTVKKPSTKARLGLTGGASHTNDIKQLLDFPKFLSKDDLSKIELVFCGYDERGSKITIDENGQKVSEKAIPLEENWWWKTEQHWLKYFKDGESYLRVPTTTIDNGEYGHIYENIDILLVPLSFTEFNSCKSELKFIEAGFTGTAIIASNSTPYREFGRDNEDCMLVKEQTARAWAMKISKMLKNKEWKKQAAKLNERVIAERSLEMITGFILSFYSFF